MALEVRRVQPEEIEEWLAVLSRTFQIDPTEESSERWRKHFDWDRSMGVFAGEEVVGTGGAFTFEFQVPGGEVAAGGLTAIAVSPTHRRRGALSAMIRHHFDDVTGHGETMSALWASESSIYERFGYGQATRFSDITVGPDRIEFLETVDPTGTVRHIDLDEARKMLPQLYTAAVVRPGMCSRDDDFWELEVFRDPESFRAGKTANRWVVYEQEGEARGYMRYRQKSNWTNEGFPEGEAYVGELISLDEDAYRALWAFALGLDLTARVKAILRPVDEPLRWMVTDPRRLVTFTAEGLWLRLLDIPACLEARRYPQTGRLVLEVLDEFLPERSGRFELVGGPDEARCAPTENEPDVTLAVSDLARLYLGDGEVASLAYAGRLRGGDGPMRLLDAMFRWHEPPWCNQMF